MMQASRPRHSLTQRLPLALLMISACGPPAAPTIPVHATTGRLLTAAGKPAAGATVSFHPAGQTKPLPFVPHGRVDTDGTFRLTSYKVGDGTPAGEYDVTVTWRSTNPDGEDMGPDRLKGKYADPKKPLCRTTVREGENLLEPFRLR
ncbi:MAG: carboxypeptidase-like regulatory domain-containing protein [Isosphaeraceae bacterium]|nr:carboxypeptidase-like regulatory domain-containing protein [Isosphaeraceae bacterium]